MVTLVVSQLISQKLIEGCIYLYYYQIIHMVITLPKSSSYVITITMSSIYRRLVEKR